MDFSERIQLSEEITNVIIDVLADRKGLSDSLEEMDRETFEQLKQELSETIFSCLGGC